EHGATDASLVRITVDGTNDAPVVSEGVALAAREDTGIILTEEQLLAHASDVDGGVLSVQNLSAENGVIADNGNGTWTFTPSKHFSGQATLSYEVFDGTDSTPASGIVAVGAVADAPTVFVQVANLDYQPNDTADFSEAQAGVRFDLTNHDAQTVDGSTDRWDAAEATGSDFDDTFSFSDLQAGETYTVHGGGGTNTIDLSAFSSDRVTLDNEARILTVDVDGAGNTATIHYDNVTRVDFDTSVFDGSPHSVELATDHDWRIEGKSIEVFSRGGSDWAVTPVGFAGALDENYTLEATVTAHRDGSWANGAIVFDYQDENNFKMAVARIGADRWSIEQFSNGVHSTIAQTGYIRLDRAVLNTIELRVEGSVASIFSGGELQVSHDFGEPLNDGRIGVATNNSHTSFELDMAPSNWAPSVEDYDIRMQLQDGAIATDNVLQDAVDPEGAELVLAGFSQGAHGTVTDNGDGTFSYRPAAGWVGSDSFTYQVSDGVNVTEGTVNVDVQGDAAVSILRGETVSLDLGASLVDADGSETLTVRLEGVPEGVSLTDGTITRVAGADGVIDVSDMNTDQMTLTPPPEFRDGFEVTVRATATEQDGGSAETTSIFDVFIINDAPVITGPAEFTLAEDGTLTITAEDLLANVADPNNDALTVQNLATADGSLADNGDGTWTFTPDGDFNGQIALSYDVDDGMDTVPATGTIVVTPVNDAPVAGAEVLASVDEGAAAVSGQLTATDADDDAMLTFTVSEGTTAPAGFTLNPDGSFVFDPADSAYDYLNVGDSVTLTVPVTVADEHGATDAGQIRITVGGTNDAPVAGAEVLASADEGAGTITGQVTAVDVDDDAVLAFSISEGAVAPAGFTLSPDGSFTFDPSDPAYDHLGAGDSVTLTMPVTVADEHGATDSSQVRITVTGTNDAPVVSESVVVAAQEDTALVITEEQLLANVSDAEGDGLSVENLAAAGGSLADNGNGTWTFTPDADFSGDVALSYDVSDGTASTHVNGTISVAGVADGATITLEGAVGESLASFGDDNITKRGPAAKLSGWETDNAGGHVEAYEDWVYGVEDGRGLVVELERNRADASNIYRYMDVEEGDTARLTFDLSARAEGAGEDSGVDVMWEGQVVDTIVPEVGWESYTYTFTATEDQPRLELKATNADGFGAVLDVIQVSEVTTDVLEDSAVAVKLDAQLLDIDGSESLQSLTVDDLAVGATVSDGANTVVVAEAGQAVDVRDWDLNNLTIKPEPDFSGELVIHVSATTRDTGGDTRTTTASTSFDIVGVNDAPVVAVTDASVASGATQAVATASDVDGIIDSHTLSAVHGTAVLDADGNILYTSEDGYIGSDTITISLTDDVGAVTQETLTLDVRNPVIGTGRDDVLTGTADNDFISGLSGDDVLEGGGGSDELAGGDGIDTVVFSGARDEYRIAETGEGVFTVTDTVSDRDGGDTLSQMEILQFNDQTLTYNGEDWVQQVEAAPEAMLAQEDGNWLGAVEEPAAEEHVGGEAEPDMDAGTEDGSPLADLDAEDANTLII
ncbi:MAG: tandem-95 repeat protein, partial [Desulfovibrionaceae bacterium]|nr:tandem-95 repeat protein [Desulfovibrionaceae bacterium]